MLKSSESIIQLQSKAVLSDVNLLIVTDRPQSCQTLTARLQASNIDFRYDFTSSERVEVDNVSSTQHQYHAIVYDCVVTDNDDEIELLIDKLQWWTHLYPNLPLILITDILGDEIAAKLVQSGVNGYVLRHNLDRLPDAIEKSLSDFANQQAIVKQQHDLIQEQQSQLRHLREAVKVYLDREKQQQKSIEQQHERIIELETKVQSSIELEQSRQEHLAHLNHELRSPISSMLGFAGMLKEQYYGALNERQMRYINATLSVGQYMLDLVNNYLDIAKIDANKQTLDLEKLAVAEVCQNALFCIEKKAEQKGLELKFELDDDVDFCLADSRCLRQILTNLLSNAVKFTEGGSVTLKVQHDRELLKFSVVDTGEGISAANRLKLFKPFPQITNHRESTGLGLALSRKLARLHQGDIVATSELGEGSCFTLTIPRITEP